MEKTKIGKLNIGLQPKQMFAFNSPATEILYGGAVGGGKSYLLRAAAIAWAIDIPGLQIYLFRRTYNELRKSHMEGPTGFQALLKPWADIGHVKIVKEEVRFRNGSRIFLSHCQKEEDVHKYLSTEMHVLMIDEASTFTETMYKALRLRVRLSGLDIPEQYWLKDREGNFIYRTDPETGERVPEKSFPRILLSSNPGGIGHQWLKAAFVDSPNAHKIRLMPPAEGGRRRQFIKALLDDNPALMRDDPTYAESLEGAGSPELVRAMRYGDWNVVAGAYFPEFDINRHTIRPFRIPNHWTRLQGGDWGYSTPFGFLWGAVCPADFMTPDSTFIPKGALIIYREWYGILRENGKYRWNVGLRMTAEEVAQEILKLEGTEEVYDRVLDTAAFNRTGNGPSHAEHMQRKGVFVRRSDRTRIAGWNELRQRLRGDGETPQIFLFDTCEHTIRTFPMQQHNPANLEDMITSGEDHLMDALRYLVMARPQTGSVPTPKPNKFRNPTLDELAKIVELESANRSNQRI